MNGISRLTLLAIVSASLAGCVAVPVEEHALYYEEYAEPVTLPPPPPRYEYPGYAPVVGSVWITGNWNWGGSRYIWVPGRWETPREGHYWVPHRWERDGDHWRQHGGRWERDTRELPTQHPEPRIEHHELRPDPIPFARPESDRHPGPEFSNHGRPPLQPNPTVRPERDRSPRVERNIIQRPERVDQQPPIEGTRSRVEGNIPRPVAREAQPARDQRSTPPPTSYKKKPGRKSEANSQPHRRGKDDER
jgi:hypothetical protein